MANNEKIKIDAMFATLLKSANTIIDKLNDIDPTSEQFETALDNLTKVFTILSGAAINKKDGNNDSNGGK
jgi:hypothetical protein